ILERRFHIHSLPNIQAKGACPRHDSRSNFSQPSELMRILKVTQAYYPFQNRGGPAFKVRSIARVLVAQGHKVTVLTADLGFGASEVTTVAAARSPQGWRSDMDGIDVNYLATRGHYRSVTVNPGVVGFCRRRLSEFD